MLLRWCEYFLLFWVMPVSLFFFREYLGYLLIPLIVLIAFVCGFLLWRKGILQTQWQLMHMFRPGLLKPIFLPFVILAVPILLAVLLFMPEKFMDLPLNATGSWLLIVLLYPVFSVLPQELIFRSYFFHRYRRLFASEQTRWLLSSFSFGLAHLLYANWIAVLMAFFGGLLFGYRFILSGNLAVVVIEHSLWGIFVFTSGLGSYFIVSQWF